MVISLTSSERGKSVTERFIEEGHEFVLGPPPQPNKTRGAPRVHQLQKLAPKIDMYARKLREMYHREGTIDPQKMYLNPLRMR